MSVPEETSAPPASKTRMTIYYTILAAITAIVAIVVVSAGHDEKAQKPIAGGYDATAPNACLGATPPKPTGAPLPATAPAQPAVGGPSFDVKQSGQFVNFSNPQYTLGGKLRLHGGTGDAPRKLDGDVKCVNGKTEHFVGTATPGPKGQISGTLGGAPVTAVFRRDPPDPGTPRWRAPANIAGPYRLSPRSTCFGGTLQLDKKSGSTYAVSAKDQDLGQLAYNDKTGLLTGDVACARGGRAKFKATAVDRNLNNVTVIPLDAATPAPVLHHAA